MDESDSLAVITTKPPAFSEAEAVDIAARHYGIDVRVRPLVSERDQNFRMIAADGGEYVLKIANAAEDRVVTDFQVQALLYIERSIRERELPVTVPRIQTTLSGEPMFELASPDGPCAVRVVSFVAGRPLAERLPTPLLAHRLGECLAWLGRALQGFTHPGSKHSLLWDMQRALELRKLGRYVREPQVASCVEGALDDFERHAAPVLEQLRSQVIHSDLNPDNVVVDTDDAERVVGVIDFGDMLSAPLIADVAIACSYLRIPDGDPLALARTFVKGYQEVTPLREEELSILFELIQARLVASITILDWRHFLRGPDDPYLEKTVRAENSAGQFLMRLRQLPRATARDSFLALAGTDRRQE